MIIAFINPALVFDINTPYQNPLGGSESAMCYLAEHLARLGHKVILLTRLSQKSTKRGVICIPLDKITNDILVSLDILVVQNSPLQGIKIKKYLHPKTKLVLWTQHAHDQPAVSPLANPLIQQLFDAFVLISQWQLDSYISSFKLPKNKCTILHNAVSPAFENLIFKKTLPPILVYTSTPFRGLDLLIRLFPSIRKAIPGITLRIYSSMQVYQTPKELEQKDYGDLYRLCGETEGVEYKGSISQSKLAKELRAVSILAYPNTFAETSCISVMEAMAAGCQVITSDLGALPETTAGFANLIPMNPNYSQNFIDATIAALENPTDRSKQVAFANRNYTWTKRALEWHRFLTKI